MGWSFAFRRFARGNEPIKVDGDKRIPAGVFRIGRSFGHGPSSRPGYLRLKNGVVCVDDAASRAYNTITTRQKVGWKVHGENMWRIPEYRHGLLVDYPTGRKQRGGSCIFIHVRMPGATGTHGCVAMTEGHVLALQDFAAPGAVLAVMPSNALERMASCLPDPASH
jgi:L,D-peptidoglycan transpeptidase YkuD (ErfK/YbiS/YcfS/YnhG family)